MTILMILTLAFTAFSSWSYLCFQKNWRIAVATGLPTVSAPAFELNLAFYCITSTPLFRWAVKTGPSFLTNWSKYARQNWRWDAKNTFHATLGGVFLVVSPRKITLEVADHKVVQEIISNREGFQKPVWMFEIVETYGENVVTTEHEKWKRHRRFTTPAFNERNNDRVWKESIIQVQGMLSTWEARPRIATGCVINEIGEDFRKFALLVISAAGYGMRIPYNPAHLQLEADRTGAEELAFDPTKPFPPPAKTHLPYFSAIQVVTKRFIDVLILRRIWPLGLRSFAPARIRTALDGYHDLGVYLDKMIDYNKSKPMTSSSQASPTLIETVVRGIDPKSTLPENRLTDEEARGNAFIFTVAGHETTGATFEFAFLLLALFPEKQSWLHQELDRDLADLSTDPEEWDYHTLFPQMRAPLAVMNEALRLYPPTIIIVKEASDGHQSLKIEGRKVQCPSNMLVTLNTAALHYNEKYWGQDVGEFKPERWVKTAAVASADTNNPPTNPLSKFDVGRIAGYPDIYNPEKGIFMPFSDGVRGCLGKKFAQVEFVAALAVLMREFSVELFAESAAEMEITRKKALAALADSQLELTLRIKEEIPLVLKKRQR